VDVSAFFPRYHLPKLRSLHLYGCQISSWGLLKSHTSALTTLMLKPKQLPPDPTFSHLLSVLSSSPLLRDLSLFLGPGSHAINGDAPTIRVQLRHLEQLQLTGHLLRVFTLLNDGFIRMFAIGPLTNPWTIPRGPCSTSRRGSGWRNRTFCRIHPRIPLRPRKGYVHRREGCVHRRWPHQSGLVCGGDGGHERGTGKRRSR